MTPELPRKPKRLAHIVRVDVYAQTDALVDPLGEAWAATEDDGTLITVGPDVAAVTQAARFSGYWIADQPA
jgi:hypothetical protein